jgi:hypothetical protein
MVTNPEVLEIVAKSHRHISRAYKSRANRLVHEAIVKGVLVRPETCTLCGDIPGLSKAGSPKIHGHHHDYDKPLDVEWICVRCHRAVTENGYSTRTHCLKGHAYANDNLMFDCRGHRRCKTCHLEGCADLAERHKLPDSQRIAPIPATCRYGHPLNNVNLRMDGARPRCRACKNINQRMHREQAP